MFEECHVAGLLAYCRPPHWTPDKLQELSRFRRMKVVTDSLETDAHGTAVKEASGVNTCLLAHDYVA